MVRGRLHGLHLLRPPPLAALFLPQRPLLGIPILESQTDPLAQAVMTVPCAGHCPRPSATPVQQRWRQ